MIGQSAHVRARNSPADHAGPFTMKFLRIKQVMQVTGLSRMTIYRLELAGKFPKRRQLSENSVAWLESDIAAWADSRPVAPLRGTPPGRATSASA
jgi:prophage regulatory protein